jgi:hypothetical protein
MIVNICSGSGAAVPMTLRQGLGARVRRPARSGHDPLKSPRCGRCFGGISNRDATRVGPGNRGVAAQVKLIGAVALVAGQFGRFG